MQLSILKFKKFPKTNIFDFVCKGHVFSPSKTFHSLEKQLQIKFLIKFSQPESSRNTVVTGNVY